VIVGKMWQRPRVLDEPARDVMILAAHQDDCVIAAGEYGIAALDAKRTVESGVSDLW